MKWSRKCLCITCAGIVGILLVASTAYACCGMYPEVTDDPIDVACVGQEVTVSGTISAVEEWPGSYSTDVGMTIEVTSPSGDVTQLNVTLSNLQEFPGPPPSATVDFAGKYTPTEAGTYTYVKTASWTTWYGTMYNSVPGSFEVVQCPGKVTGGGWFVRSAQNAGKNNKDTFGFVAQYVQDSLTPQGNLEFQAHGGAVNIHSTTITGLYVTGNSATFKGLCTVNGTPGFKFIVEVVDNGEPGKDNDTLAITVPTAFAIPTTTLDGGNIQVHKPK